MKNRLLFSVMALLFTAISVFLIKNKNQQGNKERKIWWKNHLELMISARQRRFPNKIGLFSVGLLGNVRYKNVLIFILLQNLYVLSHSEKIWFSISKIIIFTSTFSSKLQSQISWPLSFDLLGFCRAPSKWTFLMENQKKTTFSWNPRQHSQNLRWIYEIWCGSLQKLKIWFGFVPNLVY